MTFNTEQSRVPTSIGDIVITLHDNVQGETPEQTAYYRIKVLDQNGNELKFLTGNLQPHLTGTQITQILAFLTDIRTQAENEILPP